MTAAEASEVDRPETAAAAVSRDRHFPSFPLPPFLPSFLPAVSSSSPADLCHLILAQTRAISRRIPTSAKWALLRGMTIRRIRPVYSSRFLLSDDSDLAKLRCLNLSKIRIKLQAHPLPLLKTLDLPKWT